jgi:hypothetical protein
LRHAEETDTVVLFIADHGFNYGLNFRFLPTNTEVADGTLKATVVPWHTLQEAVRRPKAAAFCSSTPATPETPTTIVAQFRHCPSEPSTIA